MDYLDSHCHLNDDYFNETLSDMIKEANEAGTKTMLVIGYDPASCRKALQIAHEFPNIYVAVGVHPENFEGFEMSVLSEIEEMAKDPSVIAIGEIGLDYHWYKEEDHRARQKEWFIAQIDMANRLNLPASIHAREAYGDLYEILKEHPINAGAVLHCYSGSKEMIPLFAKLGYYFGFDGPITYKNAVEPKECVKACPLDRILVETDSPYLTPVPFRGKRNSPAYIPYIVEAIAALKGLSVPEIKEAIGQNFERLFRVKL